MKRIRVAIVGYGNLGKAVEEELRINERFNLVCIFSRRNVVVKNVPVDRPENIHKYKYKIDILFMCGGSSGNMVESVKEGLKYFCTIDAYDNHSKINYYINECNKTAANYNKVAFCCFGWDPGIFSLMRVLFNFLEEKTYTSWGRGISQGHGEAIRRIANVKDAVQYTLPNKKIIKKIKCGQNVDNSFALHKRKCFVVADKKYQKGIKSEIINMPNYFKGYKTMVKFVSKNKIKKYKQFYHGGQVFTDKGNFEFKFKTKSNPQSTAKIMVCYALILFKYFKDKRYGAYSILDVPFSKLLKNCKKYI